MKASVIYDFLKARFLIDENAIENWKFILFVIFLAMIMIANIHRYEAKIFRVATLSEEVKSLRAEYVEKKSRLMKLKMESELVKKMELRALYQSDTPPQKIKVEIEKEGNWIEKLWN